MIKLLATTPSFNPHLAACLASLSIILLMNCTRSCTLNPNQESLNPDTITIVRINSCVPALFSPRKKNTYPISQ